MVTAKEFAAKFKSKYEIYLFLVTDCDAYLPPCDVVTIYFMKDLIMGKKKCKCIKALVLILLVVKNSSLKRIHVPHYENLRRVELFQTVIGPKPEHHVYFPIVKEMKKLPREWLMNMMMTLNPVQFGALIKERINERHKAVVAKRNLGIELDPAIAQAFNSSTAVSTSKGVSADMLKIGSKRRRTKEEVIADKKAEADAKAEAQRKV